jgi:hypothetical protein
MNKFFLSVFTFLMLFIASFVSGEPTLINKIVTISFILIIFISLYLSRRSEEDIDLLYGSLCGGIVILAILGLYISSGLLAYKTDLIDSSYYPIFIFPLFLIFGIWAGMPYFKNNSLKSIIGVATVFGLCVGSLASAHFSVHALNVSFANPDPKVQEITVLDKIKPIGRGVGTGYKILAQVSRGSIVVKDYYMVHPKTYSSLEEGGSAFVSTYIGGLGIRYQQVKSK